MDKLKSVFSIFPIMIYYAIEALIVALFITVIWNTLLIDKFGRIGYFQWTAIYWIVKMLLFDVFKLISGFGIGNNINEEIKKEE